VSGRFRIEPLSKQHDRSGFHCGTEALDRYFREQVSQDVRRRAAGCYVAVERESGKIAGFYTLAASGIALDEMPEALVKRLPRYPIVPVARLGRLAVDEAFRGCKLGAALLWDAAARAARSEVAVFALIVDAKDEQAKAFYGHHGFVAYGSLPRQFILPLANIPV
jgi:ribosomal protein S18 acetylase RimI-like enzyme